MEGGYMLDSIIAFVVIVLMFTATIYVGYKRQQYKYHKRANNWMHHNLKNRSKKNDKT